MEATASSIDLHELEQLLARQLTSLQRACGVAAAAKKSVQAQRECARRELLLRPNLNLPAQEDARFTSELDIALDELLIRCCGAELGQEPSNDMLPSYGDDEPWVLLFDSVQHDFSGSRDP